jgi:sugar phosphate isomerase/epimerase
VITDDGARRPGWASLAENQTLMRCVLEAATDAAETRNIVVALETHGEYTVTPDQLAATLALVNSPALAINFDTGNSFLSGNDPCAWLESIIDRVVHVHAKDISHENARLYRGKVRGMLGCACGDGVIHWGRLVRTCERAPRDLVLSVECDTIEDAQRSPEQLSAIAANE